MKDDDSRENQDDAWANHCGSMVWALKIEITPTIPAAMAVHTYHLLRHRRGLTDDHGGSKASIVTEQFGKELSVFYRDGQSLLMTHFCNAGNQPRLRLGENTRPGVFEFQMFDITNLQSADADHVERVVYRIIDDKKIDLEIVWKNGKSEESEKYTLTRLDSEQHVGN